MKIKNDKEVIKSLQNHHKIQMDFRVDDAFGDLSAKDRKNAKQLVAQIEASHAGIINGNNFFYLPKGMANGAQTFVKPFNKPVLVNHDRESDPIGRVIQSSYVDYSLQNSPMIQNSNYPVDVLEQILDFTKSQVFTDQNYKGLGHLDLIAEITDTEAIQKILDKRYLTVSIGGTCSDVTCSRCGANIKDELQALMTGKSEKKESDCFHDLGLKYNNNEPALFYIAGDMEFDEVSYVSTPADPNAVSRVANSKKVNDSITICDIKFGKPEGSTIYFNITSKDNKQESTQVMKTKLKDFLAKPEETLALVKQTLKDIGLEALILSDERYSAMRKTSFLFADEKALPIHDKAHILVAYKILENLEDEQDGKTLSSAATILDSKAKRIFGDNLNKDEALTTLVAEVVKAGKTEEANTQVTDEAKAAEEAAALAAAEAAKVAAATADANTGTLVIDYEKLADELSKKLTDLINKENKNAYDFLVKRNDLLEKELEDALNRETQVTDAIKNIIIDHILTIDTTETVEKLKDRTLDYLKD